MTKVMRKEARHTQRRDRASGVPLEILEHIPPKPESAYFLLVLSPKPLLLTPIILINTLPGTQQVRDMET